MPPPSTTRPLTCRRRFYGHKIAAIAAMHQNNAIRGDGAEVAACPAEGTASMSITSKPGGVHPPSSLIIESVSPIVDCGRYSVKREVGDLFVVEADIFKD